VEAEGSKGGHLQVDGHERREGRPRTGRVPKAEAPQRMLPGSQPRVLRGHQGRHKAHRQRHDCATRQHGQRTGRVSAALEVIHACAAAGRHLSNDFHAVLEVTIVVCACHALHSPDQFVETLHRDRC
jgi:hypothetical protein